MADVIMQPFRNGTRRHRMQLDNVAHANGTNLESIEIKPVGWVAGLIVEAELSVVTGASAVWGDNGPWGIVSKFEVELNGQSFSPFSCGGYEAHQMNLARRQGGQPDRLHWGAPAVDSNFIATSIAASTTQTVKLLWYLPFTPNQAASMEVGLIPMLARELTGYLRISTNALASLGTAITGITGTWYTTVVYYNNPVRTALPDGRVIMYDRPPLQGVRTFSQDTLIKADNSEHNIVLPREGTIIEAMHVIRVNALRKDFFDTLELRLGNSNKQDKVRRSVAKYENAVRYGEVPTGVIFHQISDDFEASNILTLRDALNTTNIALSEAVLAINTSGAGLGASNNLVTSVFKVIVPYDFTYTQQVLGG